MLKYHGTRTGVSTLLPEEEPLSIGLANRFDAGGTIRNAHCLAFSLLYFLIASLDSNI